MAKNIVASMSATLNLESDGAFKQLVKDLGEAQVFADKHKITYRFTSDKSDLERIVREAETLSPEVKAGIVFDFDAKAYTDQMKMLESYAEQDAKAIGKSFQKSMTNTLSNMKIQDVISQQLGEGVEKTKDNLEDLFKQLYASVKSFDISKVASLDDIEKHLTELQQLNVIATDLRKSFGKNSVGRGKGTIKLDQTFSTDIANRMEQTYSQAGETIFKNLSQWTTQLQGSFEHMFGLVQKLITNFGKGLDGSFSGNDTSKELEEITQRIKEQEAALESAKKAAQEYNAILAKGADGLEDLRAKVKHTYDAMTKNKDQDSAAEFQKAIQTYIGMGGVIDEESFGWSSSKLISSAYERFAKTKNPKGYVAIDKIQDLKKVAAEANVVVAQLTQSLEVLYKRKKELESFFGGKGGTGDGDGKSSEEIAELTKRVETLEGTISEMQEKLTSLDGEAFQQMQKDIEGVKQDLEDAIEKLKEFKALSGDDMGTKQPRDVTSTYSKLNDEIERWIDNNVNKQLYPATYQFDNYKDAINIMQDYIAKLNEIKTSDGYDTMSQSIKDNVELSITYLSDLITTSEKVIKTQDKFNNQNTLDDKIREMTGTTAGDEYNKYFNMLAQGTQIEEILEQVRKDFELTYDEASKKWVKISSLMAKKPSDQSSVLSGVDNTAIGMQDKLELKVEETTSALEEQEKVVKKILYHWGNFNSGKVGESFNQMITSYFTGIKDPKAKSPYGAFGTGVYSISNPERFASIDTSTEDPLRKFMAIDVSNLKMYETKTEEHATALFNFLTKLQQMCINLATGFDYDGKFDASTVSVDGMYQEAKNLFANMDMTYEQYIEFINHMQELVKKSGLGTGKVVRPNGEGKDNISTKFMRALGYQGIDNTGTSYDSLTHGSVIFDKPAFSMVTKWDTAAEAVEHYNTNVKTAIQLTEQVDQTESLSSPTQEFDNYVQKDLVYLENYKNTVKEIDKLKIEPETDKTIAKLEELNKLADYFVSQITVLRSEDGAEISIAGLRDGYGSFGVGLTDRYTNKQLQEFEKIGKEKSGLNISSTVHEFYLIGDEISKIESQSEELRKSLRQALVDSTKYVTDLRLSLETIAQSQEELKIETSPKWIEAYNKDIDKALTKFPELERFKDRFTTEDSALHFIKSDEWNEFLSTLPQAKAYLESIGYEFKEIAQVDQSSVLSGTDSIKNEIEKLENEFKSDSGTGLIQSLLFGEDGHIKMPSTLLKEIDDIEKEISARIAKDVWANIKDLTDKKSKLIVSSTLNHLLSPDDVSKYMHPNMIYNEANRLGLNDFVGQFEDIDHTASVFSDLIAKVRELHSLQSPSQSDKTPLSSADSAIQTQESLEQQTEETTASINEQANAVDNLRKMYDDLRTAFDALPKRTTEYPEEYVYDISDAKKYADFTYDGEDSDVFGERYEQRLASIREAIQLTYKKIKEMQTAISKHGGHLGDEIYDERDIEQAKQGLMGLFEMYAANKGDLDSLDVKLTKPFKAMVETVKEAMAANTARKKQYEAETKAILENNNEQIQSYKELYMATSAAFEAAKSSDKKYEYHSADSLLPDIYTGLDDDEYSLLSPIDGGSFESICKYLGIEIPQAAEKADRAIREVVTAPSSTDSAIAEQNQLQAELQETQQEARETAAALAKVDAPADSSPVINAESEAFDTVKQSVTELTNAINEKTNAIINEKNEMDVAAQSEVQSVQSVTNEIAKLDTKIRNLADLKIEIAGFEKLNEINNLDLTKLSIKGGTLQDLTNLTYVLETLQNILNTTNLGVKLAELKTGLQGLDFSGLNKLKLNKDAFTALSKLTEDDLNNLHLLAEVLKDLANLPTLQTSDKSLLAGIKLTKSQAENLTTAATGIINLKNSLTGFDSVTASISAIDELIKKIATLKGVVNNIKDIKVEVVEGTTPGKTKVKVSDGAAKKQATEVQQLKDNYSELYSVLKRINELKVLQVNDSLSTDEQKEFNDLLARETELRKGIENFQNNGIQNQKEALKLQELQNSLKREYIEQTGGTAFKIKDADITKYNNALKVDSSRYVDSAAIDEAKRKLDEFYTQMTDGAKRSAEENSKLQQNFNAQIQTINELTQATNLLEQSSGASYIGKVDLNDGDIVQQKDKILQLVSALNQGQVSFETFTRGHKAMVVSIKGSDGQLKKYQIALNKATGAVTMLYLRENQYMSAGQKWVSGVKKKIYELTQYISGISIITRLWTELQRGFTIIRELDTALTEMRKVSDETVTSLKNFQRASFDIAESVGTTAQAIQNSTANFLRLGYTLQEASELAEDANIYANVGDMKIDEATEHMISSIKAWGSEFSSEVEASETIIDRYNEIGNMFAISSADIGAAMEVSAAALKAGGNTLNESLGLLVSGNLIQQDASTTAAALKILSLRIRGAKAELEDMGESTDGLVTSTSKLREEIKALSGVDIMLDDKTFKSTAQIVKELGAVYESLDDVSQAALLEKIAGKNRASTVEGLLQNYELIDEVIKAAEGATGSALAENEKYVDSLNGKISQLTNNVQEFWSTFIDTEFVKNAIDILSGIVKLGTDAIDTFGAFPTIIGAIGAAINSKLDLDWISYDSKENAWGGIIHDFAEVKKEAAKVKPELERLVSQTITAGNFDDIVKRCNIATDSVKGFMKEMEKSGTVYANSKDAIKGYNAYLKSTGTATKTATAGTKALAGTMKVLSSIGWMALITAITWGLSEITKAIDEHIVTTDELKDKVSDLMGEFDSAIDSANKNAKATEDLIDDYERLSKGVNTLGENVSLTNDEYGDYNAIVNEIADMFPQLIQGYTDEGTAILNLKGNVEGLRDAYREAQAEAYNLLITSGDDIITNYKNQVNGSDERSWQKSWTYSADGSINATKDIITRLSNAVTPEEFRDIYDNLIEEYQDIWASDKVRDSLKTSGFWELASKWYDVTDEDLVNVKATARATILTLNAEIDNQVREARSLIDAYFHMDPNYNKLDAQAKSVGSIIANSIDEAVASTFEYGTDAGVYADKIIAMLSDDSPIKDEIIKLFTTDISDMPLDEAKVFIDGYIASMAEYLKEDQNELKLRLGFDDVDTLYDNFKTVLNATKEKFTLEESLSAYRQAIEDEYTKIQDWGLGNYEQAIKDGTIQSVFGNVDMDRRTIIKWSDELKQTYQDELASWGYDPEISSIDTVFGGSGRFGEDLNGIGWEVAFTPILPDGTFLSQDAVYDYINAILTEAYADGQVTEDELTKIDAQGRQIGNTFVHGIFAGIDDSQEYENNGNWAETVGRLMHFSGDYGAIELARQAYEDESNFDWETWMNENSINTQNEIAFWKKCIDESETRDEAMQKYLAESEDIVAKFNIADHKETIDNFQSTISSLGDALAKIKDGSITDGELVDLAQEFTSLDIESKTLEQDIQNLIDKALNDLLSSMENPPEGLVELLTKIAEEAKDAADEVKELAGALSDLESAHDLLEAVKEDMKVGGINVSNLQKIINMYDDLEVEVAKYNAGIISSQDLYDALEKKYYEDYEAYKWSNALKLAENEDYRINVLGIESDIINEFKEAYGIDLKNYNNLAQAKLEIEQKLHDQLTDLWKTSAPKDVWGNDANTASEWEDFFSVKQNESGEYTLESTGRAEYVDPRLGAIIGSVGDFPEYDYTERYTNLLHAATSYVAKMNEANAILEDVTANFEGYRTPEFSGDDGENAKEAIEIYDWYATSIERLEREIENLDYIIDDDNKTLTERNKALKDQIDYTEDLKDAYGEAAEAYLGEFNAVGLPKEYTEKIKNGTFDIQELDPNKESDAKIIEMLEEAMPWYDKYLDAKDNELKTEQELAELREKNLADTLEQYDWIERKIEKITRDIGKYNELADNTFLNYGSRASSLENAINATIDKEIPAREKRLKELQKLEKEFELGKEYKDLVKYGGNIIEDDLTADELAKINEYKTIIDDINAEKDAIDAANESLRNYYQTRISLTESRYNDEIGDLEQGLADLNTALENASYTGIDKSGIFDAIIEKNLQVASTSREAADAIEKYINKLVKKGVLSKTSQEYQALMSIVEGFRNSANDAELAAKDAAIQDFNDIVAQYDRVLSDYEYRAQLIENDLAKAEAKGYITNTKYYEQLVNNALGTLSENYAKKAALETELADIMANDPTFVEGYEKWNELNDSIEAVTLAIAEGELSLIEYANAMRQIEWDVFDFLQDQISMITNEADFLIALMENKKLYDDKGQFTDEGLATMGQHGINYDVYVEQAKNYAKEIKKINEKLANDPSNTIYLQQKKTYVEAHQDMILAAEDEKYAIIDMVEEAMNLELESLDELITKYGEALDAEKD